MPRALRSRSLLENQEFNLIAPPPAPTPIEAGNPPAPCSKVIVLRALGGQSGQVAPHARRYRPDRLKQVWQAGQQLLMAHVEECCGNANCADSDSFWSTHWRRDTVAAWHELLLIRC